MTQVTDLADPRRCKGSDAQGQCRQQALEESDYCQQHGGRNVVPARQMRKYLLATAEDQGLLERYADDDQLKSLREEIALCRVMIQNTARTARTEVEQVTAYSKINTLLLTLERLLKTCHTLEQSLGQLVALPALIRLGQQLCQIVVNRLEGVPNYEQLVDAIINDIDRAFHDLAQPGPTVEVL
ncbi:MAG: hypothetical protein ACYDH4_10515 [Candidatus Cryosericum sp.]